ncbi:MAG: META domain-containing protein [Rhodocyclales bacterium]|nr:META domain-containing protein [Rhodocyclales bacterium]
MNKAALSNCLALLCLTLLAACGTASVRETSPPSLAGSSWRLVSIQSMDDAQGTTHIDDPSRYTVSFTKDGRAHFKLNCNRANGDWAARASGSDSGNLRFGPLAATRALCPPPSVDERVVRDMAYVRSYLLKDGRLYMSLMADGGIYEWKATSSVER